MKFFANALFLLACLAGVAAHSAADVPTFRGINIAGAEMGSKVMPGVNGRDYLWPTAVEVDLYAKAGFNTIRVPFRWERLQPVLNEAFDYSEIERLDNLVASADTKKVTLLLDVHNYGNYRGEMIGSHSVSVEAFQDFWTRVATRYKDKPYLAFGLMNEPNKHKADEWANIAQAGINAIRKTGAGQLILVPGTRWTGAHSWLAKEGRLSNAEAMAGIVDPRNNFAIEMHQYFDSNSSGTSAVCVDESIGVKRLQNATSWLKATGHKGFLAEFGASKEQVCLDALKNTLEYMEKNADVWRGWTYWGASKWFGNYMFNIYPPDSSQSPQMRIIELYLSHTTHKITE